MMLEEVAVRKQTVRDRPRRVRMFVLVEVERPVREKPEARQQQCGGDGERGADDAPRCMR